MAFPSLSPVDGDTSTNSCSTCPSRALEGKLSILDGTKIWGYISLALPFLGSLKNALEPETGGFWLLRRLQFLCGICAPQHVPSGSGTVHYAPITFFLCPLLFILTSPALLEDMGGVQSARMPCTASNSTSCTPQNTRFCIRRCVQCLVVTSLIVPTSSFILFVLTRGPSTLG